MKRKLAVIIAGLALGAPMFAHRLDEYLQAIIVSVRQDQIRASMRLIPGVAVSSAVVATVDRDGNGVFSDAEQQTYAQQVLQDLSVSIDGHMVTPVLRTASFLALADMRAGVGEIHIEFAADSPAGGSERTQLSRIIINNGSLPI